jgi:cytochrome c
MQDRQNTINGWILFAGVVALGGTLLAGEIFKSEHLEHMGYPIEGVVEEGGGAAEPDKPVAFYLASADAAKGENVFKKCAACHNAAPGGANALGPALHGVMGAPIAAHPGFAFSDALKSAGGAWDWDKMSAWLANPKKFAPGTKMTFAGLSNPQDRADLMLWLNSQGGKLTVPPPPAADVAVAGAEAEGAGADKAENEAVLTEQQAIKGGQKNIGGEGAPKLTGTEPAAKKN